MLLLAWLACAHPDVDPADTDAIVATPCKPVVEAADAGWAEGDVVTATIGCETGEDPVAMGLSAIGLPDGAALDGAALTWPTDLDDAGLHEVLFSVAGDGDTPETALFRISVADAWADPENVPVVPEAYSEEWGLPVIHVLTDGPMSDVYVSADIVWKGHRHEAWAKHRGAASLGYPKPGLMLEFGDDEIDLSDQGMKTRNHLVLLTTFDDNSYVRQKLAFDLWADIAEHFGADRPTPRTFFAVVYLDGVYHGLFVGCDRIDDEFFDHRGLSRDGNVYKSVSHDADFRDKPDPRWGWEKEEGDDDWSDLLGLFAFVSASTPDAFWRDAPQYLRVDEFMDWFLFVHFMAADDSAGKNAYVYNDPEAPEFRFVPWDFNHSWGQTWQTQRVGPTVSNDFVWNNGIFEHLQRDPDASAALWERWASLVEGPFAEESIDARIDAYYAELGPAGRRDQAKWGEAYRTYGGWNWIRDDAGDWNDADGEAAYLYEWVHARSEWARTAH